MGVTIYHPFRLTAKFKRSEGFDLSVHAADLLRSMTRMPTNHAFANVAAINVGVSNITVELLPEVGEPIEKQFGAVSAELEKRGWESIGP